MQRRLILINVVIALLAVAFGFVVDRESVVPRGDDFGLLGTKWTDQTSTDSYYQYVRLQYVNANGRLGMSAIYGALQRLGRGGKPDEFPWWLLVALGTFGLVAGLVNVGLVVTRAIGEPLPLPPFLLMQAFILTNPTFWEWSRWPTLAVSYFFPFWLLSCVAVMESPRTKQPIWMTVISSGVFLVTATTSEQLLVPTFLVASTLVLARANPWKTRVRHLARLLALSVIAFSIYQLSPGARKRLDLLNLDATIAERIEIWITDPIGRVATLLTGPISVSTATVLTAVAILAVLFVAKGPSPRSFAAAAVCVLSFYGSTVNLLFSPYVPEYSFFFATVFAAVMLAMMLARVVVDFGVIMRYGLVLVALMAWAVVSVPRIRCAIEHDATLRVAKKRAYREIAELHRSTGETRFLIEEIPHEFDDDWGPVNYFHWLGIRGLDVALCTRGVTDPVSRRPISGYPAANLRTAGLGGRIIMPARSFSYLGDPPLMRGVSARDYVIAFNPQTMDYPVLEFSMITYPDIASSAAYRALIRKRFTIAPKYDPSSQSFILVPVVVASEDYTHPGRPMPVTFSWVTPAGQTDSIPVSGLAVHPDGTPKIDASYPLLRVEVGGYGSAWVGSEKATLTLLADPLD